VLYQPIIDLATGAMVSAEALLRWEHPDHGVVSPEEFIPLAEETGLIVPVGAWVLEQACGALVQWRLVQPAMSVAVNVSVHQLVSADIVGQVEAVIARTGAPPGHVCLEVTESGFMDDAEAFGGTLANLKALGVRLAIDDFGTGYSSLTYLKRYPVDALKVDRSFVTGLGTDSDDSALVAAIVAMSGALGLEVTAEGVETREELDHVRRLRCHRAQGFYLASPISRAEMMALLAESRRWPRG
jgi:EAL domain-containing protein (putative c-di-GMP-specific phosphodiesterase class I)